MAGNRGALFAYQSDRKTTDFLRLDRFQCKVSTLAGYATCLRLLSDLPSCPHRPDKWDRCDLGAILNAGKNGRGFHRRPNMSNVVVLYIGRRRGCSMPCFTRLPIAKTLGPRIRPDASDPSNYSNVGRNMQIHDPVDYPIDPQPVCRGNEQWSARSFAALRKRV